MRVKSIVSINHKTCGHTADRVIIHEQNNMRDKQSKISFYSKRIKCPECENKEMFSK